MKKLIFFFALITQGAFGQINTSIVKAGKYQMNIPDLGAKKDSAVVWDGTSKLMKFLPVSQLKAVTNLDFTATPTGGTVFSSTGNDAVIPLATTTNAGLFGPTEKTKLNGVATGATANDTDANLKNRANHTGTQPISTVTSLQASLDTKVDKVAGKGLSTEDYTTAEKTKLAGIASGATANSTDAQLRDRSTHTGTQAISTVVGLQSAIDSKINLSLIGVNNGVAPLDTGGKVPFSVLPASLMIYKGMFNAATNTPTLSDATGVIGWVYKVSVGGTINLGSGNLTLLAADFLIHNGTKWERSAGTDNVVSVNGQQGIVVLNTSHIAETTNKNYQTDAQKLYNDATSSIQTQLNGKQVAGSYEPAFSKNTAFNKNFGTTAGTVAEGNDSRINNGQTAYTWGNHASKYVLNDTSPRTDPNAQLQSSSYRFDPNANNPTNHHYSISTFGNNGNISAQLAVRLSQGDAYTRSYDASWSTWRKLLNDVNFSSYSPTLTGGGATGTWGINISGNASSATNWGGAPADFSSFGSTFNQVVGRDNGGQIKPYTDNQLKTFLGLGSNAYTSTAYLPLTGGTLSGTTWGATENTSFSWDLGTSRRLGFVKKAGFQPMLAYGNSDSFIISESNGANTDAGNSFINRLVIANGGNATFSGTVTASGGFFNSDLRLKNIIKRDGDVVYFTWNDRRDLKTHIGYIAQEVQKTNPDQIQVGSDDKKTLSVNYVEILVEKIRALEKRISIQDKKIKQLQKRK
ncbi:pyocin knob domain-containing S74 family peptidase [Flavobacterium sp. FlaQc-28]|uniref:pyocin knob domain-containing S74 family peptidase n=1 Tax=Flavobacterium sp. FlaQc-28 TaxID=3374178 RepID=UPI003756B7BE